MHNVGDGLWNPKDDLWDRLKRNQLRSEELEHERRLAEIRTGSYALVWTGTSEDLTATITRWYESGWIEAIHLEDALQKASIHFVRSDGSPAVSFTPQPTTPTDLNPRQAFVLPLLDKKGWSILDWANEANVSHATTQDYLADKTKPYASTRLKLAKALGILVQQLPR